MNMRKKLREFFTMTRRAEEGFTLVELIVVIAIVAILGGVAVPAYSGYIEKADRAADAQLLADVNKAFAAACMVEGLDNYNASGATASIGNDKKIDTITFPNFDTNKFNATFDSFFDNEGEFKKFEELYYETAIGGFAEDVLNEYKYGNGFISLLASDIAALRDSTFYEKLGINGLLKKIDLVSAFAKGLNESESFNKVINDPDYMRSLLKYLGEDSAVVDAYTDEEAKRAFMSAVQSMAQGDQERGDKIKANMAVLYAAQSTKDLTKDQINALFSTDNPKQALVNAVSTDSGSGISQAALFYGMYTSFANSEEYGSPERQNATDNPLELILGMDNAELTEFQNYVNSPQGQKDMDAYLSSMNMINSSTGDPEAVQDVLINGFNNDALVGVITGAVGGN